MLLTLHHFDVDSQFIQLLTALLRTRKNSLEQIERTASQSGDQASTVIMTLKPATGYFCIASISPLRSNSIPLRWDPLDRRRVAGRLSELYRLPHTI